MRCLAVVLSLMLSSSFAQSLPREVRAKILEAVVQVIPLDTETGETVSWSGSGTIISPQGHILTNFHVIGDEDTGDYYEWHAIFTTNPAAPDQNPRLSYWARFVAGDRAHDLALLKIEEFADETPVPADRVFTGMPLGDSNTLLPGDFITVVGYPGISGSTITFTAGLMSGWLGEDLRSGGKGWIKTDAKIAGGNSGGAAFDENGYLIGVPTAGLHLFEEQVYEEQLYIRPIGLAWALIAPHVANVYSAPGVSAQTAATLIPATAASSPGEASGNFGEMALGESRSNTIAAATAERLIYHSYVLEVPAGTASVTISLDGGGGDIDMAVKSGSEIMSYRPLDEGGDWDYLDFSREPNPRYTYENPPPGPLYIDVINVLEQPLDYTLTVLASTATPLASPPAPRGSGMIGAITMGSTVTGNLTIASNAHAYHTYTLEVPPGMASFTLLLDSPHDFDIAVKFGSDIVSYNDQDGDWQYRDIGVEMPTRLLIPNPQPGRWHIDVFSFPGEVQSFPYSLRVSVP